MRYNITCHRKAPWGNTGFGTRCHLAGSWPFRINPLVLAWVAFLLPCASQKNDTSGLPKQQHLAPDQGSALLLSLTANRTFPWPPTEQQRVWRWPPFRSRSQHQQQLLGLSILLPEKYFLLTFIIRHRAKSGRSGQENERKRAPFATLQHHTLIGQGDKAALSYTISLVVKTTRSALLFVGDLSLEMLIYSEIE